MQLLGVVLPEGEGVPQTGHQTRQFFAQAIDKLRFGLTARFADLNHQKHSRLSAVISEAAGNPSPAKSKMAKAPLPELSVQLLTGVRLCAACYVIGLLSATLRYSRTISGVRTLPIAAIGSNFCEGRH